MRFDFLESEIFLILFRSYILKHGLRQFSWSSCIATDFYINKIERSTVSFPSTSNCYKMKLGLPGFIPKKAWKL